jgi:hypothetical protein
MDIHNYSNNNNNGISIISYKPKIEALETKKNDDKDPHFLSCSKRRLIIIITSSITVALLIIAAVVATTTVLLLKNDKKNDCINIVTPKPTNKPVDLRFLTNLTG